MLLLPVMQGRRSPPRGKRVTTFLWRCLCQVPPKFMFVVVVAAAATAAAAAAAGAPARCGSGLGHPRRGW